MSSNKIVPLKILAVVTESLRMFQLAPEPDTVISSLSPSVTPAAVDAIVIVLPDSLNVILEPASIVTFVLPLVFDDITLVVAVPAPTVRLPSFVAEPSLSVPVIVRVFVVALYEAVLMPLPATVNVWPPKTSLFVPSEIVSTSFVAD